MSSFFKKLFGKKTEAEKEINKNKNRALNEYKYQLNELKKNKKITNQNYNLKLESFKKLINIEGQRKLKKNLSNKTNNSYYNLLNKTRLYQTKKVVKFSEKNNIKEFNKNSNTNNFIKNNNVLIETNNTSLPININKKQNNVLIERNKNIISNLINKLPQRYSKLYKKVASTKYQGMTENVGNNNKIKQFKNYVKTSIKPGNDINTIIKSYNKNKELTEENKKTILTYIASKYYTFNN